MYCTGLYFASGFAEFWIKVSGRWYLSFLPLYNSVPLFQLWAEWRITSWTFEKFITFIVKKPRQGTCSSKFEHIPLPGCIQSAIAWRSSSLKSFWTDKRKLPSPVETKIKLSSPVETKRLAANFFGLRIELPLCELDLSILVTDKGKECFYKTASTHIGFCSVVYPHTPAPKTCLRGLSLFYNDPKKITKI